MKKLTKTQTEKLARELAGQNTLVTTVTEDAARKLGYQGKMKLASADRGRGTASGQGAGRCEVGHRILRRLR